MANCFKALQIKPKDRSYTVAGGEVSTDVVPLDQLKRIAGIIDEIVRMEESTELDRARMRLCQDRDGLKAVYAAEEGKDLTAPSPPGVPLAAGASTRPLPIQTTEPIPMTSVPSGDYIGRTSKTKLVRSPTRLQTFSCHPTS